MAKYWNDNNHIQHHYCNQVQKNENTVNHHGPNLGTTTTTTTKPDGSTTTTQKPTPTPTTPNPTGTGDDGVTPTSPTGTQPEFDAGSDW